MDFSIVYVIVVAGLGVVSMFINGLSMIRPLMIFSVVLTAVVFLCRRQKGDSDKAAYYKKAVGTLIVGISSLIISVVSNNSDSYRDAFGSIIIGKNPFHSALMFIGVLLMVISVFLFVEGIIIFADEQQKKERLHRLYKWGTLLIVLLFVGSIFGIISIVKRSNSRIQRCQKQIIGESYSDVKQGAMGAGDIVDTTTIEIIDKDKLRYIVKQEEVHYRNEKFSFTILDSKTETYNYNLRSSIWGKIYISFNGRSYEMYMDDRDVISGVIIY